MITPVVPCFVGRNDAGSLVNTLPVAKVMIFGDSVPCLLDTGSALTMVDARVVEGYNCPLGAIARIVTADGRLVRDGRYFNLPLAIDGAFLWVKAVALPNLSNLGVNLIVGWDVIERFGGVGVTPTPDGGSRIVLLRRPPGLAGPLRPRAEKTSSLSLCSKRSAKSSEISGRPDKLAAGVKSVVDSIRISDKDFTATFDPKTCRWLISWHWSATEPDRLQKRVTEYASTRRVETHSKYVAEIQQWISNGWLVRWNGPVVGFIPLLAVVQPTKDKVRPVLDYRKLNPYISSHTGDDGVAVCGEKIRKWRQMNATLQIVDLKSAYLQIHVEEKLWKYQTVRFEGVTYALTRLGFGLCSAPRIMTLILRKVLSLDNEIESATDHYIDDIVVDVNRVSASRLREHLRRYGLESKEPERLDGGRLLGIALNKKSPNQCLTMSRGASLPDESDVVKDRFSKRELFSLCGKLVGHYPIAGYLRPHCSLLKRMGHGIVLSRSRFATAG